MKTKQKLEITKNKSSVVMRNSFEISEEWQNFIWKTNSEGIFGSAPLTSQK